MRVKVSAPSRLHFSLVDLSGDLGRLDGGAGVALKLPRTVVVAEESDELKYFGPRADEVLPKLERLGLKGRIKVISSPPAHVGLGSTTSLLLSCAKALSSVNGVELTARELALLTGRGGTSGVGVAVFESGGFVVDFGHDLEQKGRPLPSGASLASPPPYVRLDFPEEWTILVAFPEKGVYDEEREVDEFLKRTPIPPGESSKVARIIFMLMIPAVLEKRIDLFKKAINELQKVGFKKIENELQDEEVRAFMEKVRELSGVAGLSSMGPTVYTVVPSDEARATFERVRRELPKGWKLVMTSADNVGAMTL